MRPEEIFDAIDIYGKANYPTVVGVCDDCFRSGEINAHRGKCLSCLSVALLTHGKSQRFCGVLYADRNGAQAWVAKPTHSWYGPDITVNVSDDWLKRGFDFIYNHKGNVPSVFCLNTTRSVLSVGNMITNIDPDFIHISGPASPVPKHQYRTAMQVRRSEIRRALERNSPDKDKSTAGVFVRVMAGTCKKWSQ